VVAVVALVRFSPTVGDVEANASKIFDSAAAAARLGASVVVLPAWALSGLGPADTPPDDVLASVLRASLSQSAALARRLDKAGLGSRRVLVGVVGPAPGRAAWTVMLKGGRVALSFRAGWPDPLERPWASVLEVTGPAGEPIFAAHGHRFGVLLEAAAADAVPDGLPDGLDAVLVQQAAGAEVRSGDGRRLSPDQPESEGITLWHAN
jgi:hypothetical protein